MRQSTATGSVDESPLESDQDPDDGTGTMACPSCGKQISDMSERCAACGTYITCDGCALKCRPKMFVVTSVMVIVALALGYVCLK